MKKTIALTHLLIALSVPRLSAQEITNPVQSVPASPSLRVEMATLFGGSGEDRAHGMAVDAQGNIYLTAPIASKDFPTTPDALNRTPTGVYFAKLSAQGTLLCATYLGAPGGANYAHDIALDQSGNIYIAGNTTNPDSPTTPGAFQTKLKGPVNTAHGDAFVMKLSPAGDRIICSTLLGGTGPDICGKIAVGADGSVYVVGSTSSTDLPVTPGALQTVFKGEKDTPTGRGDLFVAKLSPDGSKLVYCTYAGGSGGETYGENIEVDPSGAVTFAGSTTSPDFPTTAHAFGKAFRGGPDQRTGGDGLLIRLNSTGTALEYASYVGGSGGDSCKSVAVDKAGNIWLTGRSTSADFPTTPDAFRRQNQGADDGFILEVDPRTGSLLYASLLGGTKAEGPPSITTHSSGLLVLAGRTESTDFPVTPGAAGTAIQGPADLYVALFDPAARSLKYCTYLGGSGHEIGGPLLCVGSSVFLAGNTTSTDFPVTTDATFRGGRNPYGGDALVVKLTLVEKSETAAKETE